MFTEGELQVKPNRFIETISSNIFMVSLLLIYAFIIAGATFFESSYDTISTKNLIYTSWWFISVQFFMAVNFVFMAQKRRLFKQKKWGVLLLHYGFVVMLLGAILTHVFGSESVLSVREGSSNNVALSSDTYISIEVKSGGESESVLDKAVYGEVVSSDFSYNFNVDGKEVDVNFLSYKKMHNGGAVLNIEILKGNDREVVSIDGGQYKFLPKTLIHIGGVEVVLQYGSRPVVLPFDIELVDFELERYPGSSSPSSYSSDVNITYDGVTTRKDIYMNNIAYIGSYRVYQTSYDPDEMGTILTVNRDLMGTIVSYIGYLMMAFGFLLAIFHKGSRFSMLKKRLKEISAVVVFAVVLIAGGGEAVAQGGAKQYISAAELAKTVAPTQVSDKFARLMVQNPNGRVEPIGSYAEKILLKIHRERSYKGIDANQVLLAMVTNQSEWGSVPMIHISNEQLCKELGVEGEYLAFIDMFDDNGEYILKDKVEVLYSKNQRDQNKYDKEILKLDEKVNILYSLFNGKMLSLFPIKDNADNKWLSMGDPLGMFTDSRDSLLAVKMIPWLAMEVNNKNIEKSMELVDMISVFQKAKASTEHIIPEQKIEAELFYNRVPIFKSSAIAYLAFGFLLLVIMLINMLRGSDIKRSVLLVTSISVVLVLFWLWHTFGIGLRWYISGRAPWTSSYESMIYVAWSSLLLGIYFIRKSPVTLAISALMAGAVMMISQLNLLDPEITPIVPVLKSYWLMFHVATITASYGFFGVAALIGIAVMIIMAASPKGALKNKVEELTIINEMAIIIGLILLSIGIFIGAVWANESWGRYWGWDPKESWALITMVVYALVLHLRFIPSMRGKFLFNMLSVYSFYTVLMTFFGVNYYLSGMHSYGNVDGIEPLIFFIPTAFVVLLTALAARKAN